MLKDLGRKRQSCARPAYIQGPMPSTVRCWLRPSPDARLKLAVGLFGSGKGVAEVQGVMRDTEVVGNPSRILDRAKAMPVPLHQQLLGDSLRVCDAVAVKLLSIGAEGLQAAARSPVPILVTGPSQALLDGTGAAYSWPRDFMNEPWSDAELLVRLFRMLETPCRCH